MLDEKRFIFFPPLILNCFKQPIIMILDEKRFIFFLHSFSIVLNNRS